MMQKILHETCQQYVARRLSEGWSIVWQKGYNLLLSSPDGRILRPVDLRNDVETLRPNAAGDETGLPQYPAIGDNWDKVDEVTPDGIDTVVYDQYGTYLRDLYELPASTGSGSINFIKVYFRIYAEMGDNTGKAKPVIKSDTTVTEGTEVDATGSWVTRSQQWNTNPADSEAWQWSDIDALQIGIALRKDGATYCNCTQLYVEVDYTPVTPKTSSDTGSGVEAKKTGNPLATLSRSETGSGVEGMPARGITLPDAGSGVEHILDRALVLISESGSGLDTVLSLLGKLRHETGSGVENSYLHILEGVKDSHETGSGAEASSLAALLQKSDSGSGVDEVITRAVHAKEYPTGAIDLAKVITAVITGAETGTGAETSLQSYYYKRTESGEGVDSSTLEAMFTRAETGEGAEAITLLAAMLASDAGVGVEAVLTYLRKLVDSGEGVEVVNIIGAVGRAMKLITYLRAYSDLTVYTKPYSDLRVYTSEVKKQ